MRIGVIGTGNMGSAFVQRLRAGGHDVVVTGRDLDKAAELGARFGAKAIEASNMGRQVDLVIAATPYHEQARALAGAGDLRDKPVVEISNPVTSDMGLAIGHNTSAAEEIARAVPEAHVVKAFNTIFAHVLSEGAQLAEGRAVVLCASDDETSKRLVQELAESLGFDSLDAGPLKNARLLEPMGLLNIYFGSVAGLGHDIAPTWLVGREETRQRRGRPRDRGEVSAR